jgi:cytochrome c oxidase cbb3-type subunit 3
MLQKFRPITALLVTFCGALPAAVAQQHAGQYDVADIEYGAQLFSQRCVVCHGVDGDLMPQANLRSGTFRNASSDRELMGVIRNGVDGTAMAATGYADAEITALVAYLRNITSWDPSASATLLGDAANGRRLFEGKGGCLECHRVGPRGPAHAPPLTDVGARRTAAALRRTLLEPDAGLLPINRPVRAVTGDGRVVEGRRLNEDTFTVQIMTTDEQLVSLDKSSLRDYSIGLDSSHPDFGAIFDEQEIADLLSWLLSLKGSVR